MKIKYSLLALVLASDLAHSAEGFCTFRLNPDFPPIMIRWDHATKLAEYEAFDGKRRGRITISEKENAWGALSIRIPNVSTGTTAGGWSETEEYEYSILPSVQHKSLPYKPPTIVYARHIAIGSTQFIVTAAKASDVFCKGFHEK